MKASLLYTSAALALPSAPSLLVSGFSLPPPASLTPLPDSSRSRLLRWSTAESAAEPAPIADEVVVVAGATATSSTRSDGDDDDDDDGHYREATFWRWRGHDIFVEVRSPLDLGAASDVDADDDGCNSEGKKKKPAVILVHGFGASTVYWRETLSVLRDDGYEVHALDLLGQGRSSKPFVVAPEGGEGESDDGFEVDADAASLSSPSVSTETMKMGRNTNARVEYSIDLWAALVDDYARHRKLDDGVVLMGNSLGSLVCLSVATGDFVVDGAGASAAYLAGKNDDAGGAVSGSVGGGGGVRGLCLFNCGVGLNSRNVLKNPDLSALQRILFGWLFDVLNFLIFDNAPLLRYALDNVVTKELLEDALKGLYVVSPERVDANLVDSFYHPAKTGGEGAVEAIRQIYTNYAGLTPTEYHEKYPDVLDSMPIHLVWGLDDVVTPLEGDVGTFYRDRVANNRGGRGTATIDCIRSGHVPFDDNPAEAHGSMTRWLRKKILK